MQRHSSFSQNILCSRLSITSTFQTYSFYRLYDEPPARSLLRSCWNNPWANRLVLRADCAASESGSPRRSVLWRAHCRGEVVGTAHLLLYLLSVLMLQSFTLSDWAFVLFVFQNRLRRVVLFWRLFEILDSDPICLFVALIKTNFGPVWGRGLFLLHRLLVHFLLLRFSHSPNYYNDNKGYY